LPVSFSLCLEHVEHWERIASRGRPAFSSHLVNALSLTTPAYFKLFLTLFEHASSSAHERRPSPSFPFICFHPNLLGPFPFISSETAFRRPDRLGREMRWVS